MLEAVLIIAAIYGLMKIVARQQIIIQDNTETMPDETVALNVDIKEFNRVPNVQLYSDFRYLDVAAVRPVVIDEVREEFQAEFTQSNHKRLPRYAADIEYTQYGY